MALTNAQMLAIVNNGGSVIYRGQILTRGTQVPSDADIAADDYADLIEENNGLITVTKNLAAADIIAMRTTPIELVPAPGSGLTNIVDNITVKMTTTATAFTGGGAVEFRYTDGSGTKVTADVAAAVVTAGAGTSYTNVRGIEASLTAVTNAKIVITNATAAFAAGTGTAVVTVNYHIV